MKATIIERTGMEPVMVFHTTNAPGTIHHKRIGIALTGGHSCLSFSPVEAHALIEALQDCLTDIRGGVVR